MSNLLEVQGSIDEAIDWLDYAISHAESCLPEGEPQAWQGMNTLIARLEEIKKQLSVIVPDDVQKAIKSEAEMLDDLADKADALSY